MLAERRGARAKTVGKWSGGADNGGWTTNARWRLLVIALGLTMALTGVAHAVSERFGGKIYNVGELKPIDSQLRVRGGIMAPDFTLPSLTGESVTLSQFFGSKNIVLSFVPAAWTPVCSDQWPGYNIARGLFEKNNAILIGITVDNIPTLHAWTLEMGGLWFPVLSDFWPHGAVAKRYGVLRGDGTSERALFVIDKRGIIRYIDVHDINQRPKLEVLIQELEKLQE
jgi:peroxiredoxin